MDLERNAGIKPEVIEGFCLLCIATAQDRSDPRSCCIQDPGLLLDHLHIFVLVHIIRRREEKQRAVFAAQAKKLEGVTVAIKARAGEEEKLFGSVTTGMIAEKLAEMGHEFDRKAIELEEPIKTLGIFTVPVRLASGIEATVKVWVTPLEEEEVTA